MLHINMNNLYCSYQPQGISVCFAAIVMRQYGIAVLSSRIPGDGYASA